MPGGGGGADLDVVTAVAGDVLKGKVIVGPDGEPLTGTLELTGNAADSQVIAGKTYYNTDAKTKRTGIMVNHGAIMVSLNCGKSFTIPAGYHNGAGEVIANSLTSQTDSNAVAGELLKDKTAYVKGNKITGTMANQGAKTASLNCGGSYTIPAGYHNGSGKVTANSLASQTDANAAAGDILKDKTAWVKGSKITGNMATMAGGTYTPSTSQQTVSCNGKKMTSDIIVKGDANLIAGNIIAGKSIFGVAGNAKVVKYKSGGPLSTSGAVTVNYTNGKQSGTYYWVQLNNPGLTPVLVVFFTGTMAAISMAPFNAFNHVMHDTMKLGNMTMPSGASFTSALIKMPIGGSISNDVWYMIAGY